MRRLCLWTLVIFAFAAALFTAFSGDRQDHQGSVLAQEADPRELEEVIRALDEAITQKEQEISGLKADIQQTELEIARAEKELSTITARFNEKVRLFGSRVRSIYIKGGMSYLEILLEADNFGDLIIRAAYLKRILSHDSRLVADLRNEQTLLQQKKSGLEEKQELLQAMLYKLEAEHQNLLAQLKEKEEILQSSRIISSRFKPVYGITIDNHPQARPQAGLAEASVVYEYEVEGITRYLALFSTFPSRVGPIRSARTHSTILALENDVRLIYASASNDVLNFIKSLPLRHTNALFAGSSSIYRDNSRWAPHNLYVNLATLGLEKKSSQVIIRPAYLDRKGSPGTYVNLQYYSYHKIEYRYNPELQAYQRYLNGKIYKDEAGNNIIARNIIVQYAPHSRDSLNRPTPNLIGSGAIDYYAQGQRFLGSWRKDSIEAPTRFYYQDGTEIQLLSGQTWIQIMQDK